MATPSTLTTLRSALAASWVVMAVFILSNAATPLYAHWQTQMGFTAGTLTVIFSTYILGLLLTLAFAGQVADHYGRRAVLLPCLCLAAIAAVMFIGASHVATLLAARILTGIAVGLVVAAGMANVVERAPESRKSSASLLASVAMVTGAGTGPLLAGLIAQYSESPVALTFGLELLLLALALPVVLRLPSGRLGDGRFRPRLPAIPRQYLATVAIGVGFFGPGITATSFVLSLGPKVLDTLLHAHNPLVTGLMAFAMFMSAVAVQFAARNLPSQRLFLASALATGGAMLCVVLAMMHGSAALMVVCALAAGAGQGLGQLGGLRLIALHLPVNRRAEANALFNMAGYVPAGALPVVAGYLVDAQGLNRAILVLAGLIGGLVVMGLIALFTSAADTRQTDAG